LGDCSGLGQQLIEDLVMDTYTLYQWASDAGLNFDNPDNYNDAIDVWLVAMLEDGTWLNDILLDWLAEGLATTQGEDGKYIQSEKWVAIGKDMARIKRDRESLESFSRSTGTKYLGNAANGLGWSLGALGETIYSLIIPQAEKYIEDHAEEWWADCMGYDYDMQEGAREDWLYEQRKDRLLEERE
jgi:hypothetical protein